MKACNEEHGPPNQPAKTWKGAPRCQFGSCLLCLFLSRSNLQGCSEDGMDACTVLQRVSTEVFAITSTKLRKVSPGPLTFISPGVLMPLSLIAHSAPK